MIRIDFILYKYRPALIDEWDSRRMHEQFHPNLKWLIQNYGDGEYWKHTFFEPRKPPKDGQWWIGAHHDRWFRSISNQSSICAWVPEEIFTHYSLRWA